MGKLDQVVIGIIVIALVVSVAFIIFTAKQKEFSNVITYKSPSGEKYYITVQNVSSKVMQYHVRSYIDKHEYIMPLRYSPYDVENIPMEEGILDKVNRPLGIKMLYLTQDPSLPKLTEQNSFTAITEYSKILGTVSGIYQLPAKAAFTSSGEREGTTVASCDDVANDVAVIEVRLGDENKIYSEGDCVIIQGVDGDGLIQTADRFAYFLLGLME